LASDSVSSVHIHFVVFVQAVCVCPRLRLACYRGNEELPTISPMTLQGLEFKLSQILTNNNFKLLLLLLLLLLMFCTQLFSCFKNFSNYIISKQCVNCLMAKSASSGTNQSILKIFSYPPPA
jgi:hypothetical protein